MRSLELENPFGASVSYIEYTESTMELARRLVRAGHGHGSVVRTDLQTKGRGRRAGRRWESRPGDSLLFTLVLETSRLSEPVHVLPILLGLAVSDVVETRSDRRCAIKWPNDVLVDGRKVSGVLCEGEGTIVYCGIGLNCNQTDFAGELERRATSLRIITGEAIDVNAILEELLAAIYQRLADPGWRGEVESRLYLHGHNVSASIETGAGLEVRNVRIEGIGESGELKLLDRDTGELRRLFGGEVTFER